MSSGNVIGQRALAWGRTLRAMALLLAARLLVAAVPFRIWRKWVGGRADTPSRGDVPAARLLATQIERAAWRLPVTIKCLPQSMALSWLLRAHRTPHSLVLAVRPPGHRSEGDDLHAWVESGGTMLIGDLPGPWLRLFEQG